MDAVQRMVKNKLGLTGQQVWAYKEMYDFIGRFSFCQANETDVWTKDIYLQDIKLDHRGEKKMIPLGALNIIEKIGTENLWMYFSPYAYEKKFESFCKKMRSEKAQMKDYYSQGLLIVDRIIAHETEYSA